MEHGMTWPEHDDVADRKVITLEPGSVAQAFVSARLAFEVTHNGWNLTVRCNLGQVAVRSDGDGMCVFYIGTENILDDEA